MKIIHDITSELQPTNVSCTQTATAMLLSHYDEKFNVARVLQDVPTQDFGSSMQELAIYCIKQGYEVEMYSFDTRILDLSWAGLSDNDLVMKLEKVKYVRNIDSLGKTFTEQYVEDYIQFIKNGGSLSILPYPNSDLLRRLVREGPICVAVNYTTLYGAGHTRDMGLRKSVQDDLENGITTHAIVVYGENDSGEFLISDPYGDPKKSTVTSDQLIASIMAAQWLCDNMLFRIVK